MQALVDRTYEVTMIKPLLQKKFKKIVTSILTNTDEAHHSSVDSYKKIMDYFTPNLWVGMTATSDQRDDNLEG